MARLRQLLEPAIADCGFVPVRILITDQPARTLQVMAEDPATGQMTLDQCAALSRRLSLLLDEADPIDGPYQLEVSSPGIDRPLTRLADFDRWAGHAARLELAEPLALGAALHRRLKARLVGTEGADVLLESETAGAIRLRHAQIASAKLLLTDALIAASAPLSADGADEIDEVDDREPGTTAKDFDA